MQAIHFRILTTLLLHEEEVSLYPQSIILEISRRARRRWWQWNDDDGQEEENNDGHGQLVRWNEYNKLYFYKVEGSKPGMPEIWDFSCKLRSYDAGSNEFKIRTFSCEWDGKNNRGILTIESGQEVSTSVADLFIFGSGGHYMASTDSSFVHASSKPVELAFFAQCRHFGETYGRKSLGLIPTCDQSLHCTRRILGCDWGTTQLVARELYLPEQCEIDRRPSKPRLDWSRILHAARMQLTSFRIYHV